MYVGSGTPKDTTLTGIPIKETINAQPLVDS